MVFAQCLKINILAKMRKFVLLLGVITAVCSNEWALDFHTEDKLNGLVKRFHSRGVSISFLPAALRAAQTCRYLVYSEADFEVYRPAGATCCTDGGEIWRGRGDRRSPPPRQISPPSVQRQGCRTPKIEIFTQI